LRHEVAAKKQKLLSGGLDKLFFLRPGGHREYSVPVEGGQSLKIEMRFSNDGLHFIFTLRRPFI
jgi:hypothetical protein